MLFQLQHVYSIFLLHTMYSYMMKCVVMCILLPILAPDRKSVLLRRSKLFNILEYTLSVDMLFAYS